MLRAITLIFIAMSSGLLSGQTIHVRLLDGRTAKPVQDVYITAYGKGWDQDKLPVQTESNGFTVEVGTSQTIYVLIAKLDHQPKEWSDYAICQPNHDDAFIPQVAAILKTGVVSKNTCGKETVLPAPGDLILFVRPLHWWERPIV